MASTTAEIASESPSVYYQNVLMDKKDDPEHIYMDLHHNKPNEMGNISGEPSAPNKQSSPENITRLGLIIWSVFSAVTIIGLLAGCIYLGTTVTCSEEKDTTDVYACISNPCQNRGTCYDSGSKYDCVCTAGWKGTHCTEEVNECRSNPCQHGATCQDGLNAYTCNCSAGWHGEICSLDVEECSSSPCHNGASCYDGVNSYTCVCPAGWYGDQCNQDLDECMSNPCHNGATCRDGVNEYSCNCKAGWKGAQCSEGVCPENFVYETKSTNCYYHDNTRRVNKSEAADICFQLGATLISVMSQDEQDFLNSIISTGERYWTSGWRDSSWDIRFFYWINYRRIPLNGDSSMDLWLPGQPNNFRGWNESAVEIRKDHLDTQALLNDIAETASFHILCQWSS